MKQIDIENQKVTGKRERDDKTVVDEPALKRPKLTMESKSAVYQSLFARKEAPKVEQPEGDFMTRCAKWGL